MTIYDDMDQAHRRYAEYERQCRVLCRQIETFKADATLTVPPAVLESLAQAEQLLKGQADRAVAVWD